MAVNVDLELNKYNTYRMIHSESSSRLNDKIYPLHISVSTQELQYPQFHQDLQHYNLVDNLNYILRP
jgi:hypothetical protein